MKHKPLLFVLYLSSTIFVVVNSCQRKSSLTKTSEGEVRSSGRISNNSLKHQYMSYYFEWINEQGFKIVSIFSKVYCNLNKRVKYAVLVTAWKHLTVENAQKVLNVWKMKELILYQIFPPDVDLKMRWAHWLTLKLAGSIMAVKNMHKDNFQSLKKMFLSKNRF